MFPSNSTNNTRLCFSIRIVDDDLVEGNEIVHIIVRATNPLDRFLADMSTSVSVVDGLSQALTVVTILDNDCK